MAIYTIGDLHLSFSTDKPMEVFGDNWYNYEEKIENNWKENVKEEDIVILPGDFSWAMYLEDTIKDFQFINNLPGKKILLKGNHDYWWTTNTNMRKFLSENNIKNIDFLYNNSYEFENKIIVGVRGWNQSDDEEDKRLNKREVNRLELSILDGTSKYGENKEIIAFMHYPPITRYHIQKNLKSDYIELMKKYNIKKCYYAHLHANSIKEAIEGNIEGINLKLVSSDGLDFKLLKV